VPLVRFTYNLWFLISILKHIRKKSQPSLCTLETCFAARRGSIGGRFGHQKEPSEDVEYANKTDTDDDDMARALQHSQMIPVANPQQPNPQTQQPTKNSWVSGLFLHK